jgi:hypothetical protein
MSTTAELFTIGQLARRTGVPARTIRARLSAQERQRIIDDFVDGVFEGTDPDAPAAGIARGMRQLPADLPDDPAPEQVDAWVELAELVASEDSGLLPRWPPRSGSHPRAQT